MDYLPSPIKMEGLVANVDNADIDIEPGKESNSLYLINECCDVLYQWLPSPTVMYLVNERLGIKEPEKLVFNKPQ